jgi:hypothetical protein
LKKTTSKKLALNRESLRRLNEATDLSQVAGGITPTTTFTEWTCVSCFYC